jgi:hypothetical protein
MPALRLLPDLEDALRRLPSVRAASVVTGPDAVPTEVHVLAAPGKPAKQVVRDVQSLALARHGIEIDHRIVSVVQLEDQDIASVAPATAESGKSGEAGESGESAESSESGSTAGSRPVLISISLRTTSTDTEAGVTVAHDGHVFEGKAAGPAGAGHRPRIVAAAALRALDDLIGTTAEVESAVVAQFGGRYVAVCVITLAEPRFGELALSGSAPVRDDEVAAVVRSVLDALNRRIAG